MKNDITSVINKVFDVCREKISNNVLIIKTDKRLCNEQNFLKAKLPINRFLETEKMPSWELLKMPKIPGTYVIEGIDSLNENVAKSIYGWALNGKANGVRAILVTKNVPDYMANKTTQIDF